MKPFSYYRRGMVLSVTSGVFRGNGEVTPDNEPKSPTSEYSDDSLSVLPVLLSEKQCLQTTEIIAGTSSDVISKTTNSDILSVGITEKSNAPIAATDERLSDSLPVTSTNLQWWIKQLKECTTREIVFDLLAKFQPLGWTDQQRALMSHAYHHQLERLPAVNTTNDGPGKPELINFQNSASNASNLDELYLVLADFARHDWALLERRDMSNSYTPMAKKLIETEGKDKYVELERLAEICWGKT